MDDHSVLSSMVASRQFQTMKVCFQSVGLLPYLHFWTGRGNDLGLDLGQRINQHVDYQLFAAKQPPL